MGAQFSWMFVSEHQGGTWSTGCCKSPALCLWGLKMGCWSNC